MTTIAYTNHTMAADRQMSTETSTNPYMYMDKMMVFNKGRSVVGFTGDAKDFYAAQKWFEGGEKLRKIPDLADFRALRADIVKDVKHVHGYRVELSVYESNFTKPLPLGDFSAMKYAIGSGQDSALAAMEMGAGVEKAIEVASKYDLYTNGFTKLAYVDAKLLKWVIA